MIAKRFDFQIGNKFRDEAHPRYGLIRSREFIMKDLYTFDIDNEHAMRTYGEISDNYVKLFEYLGVPFTKGNIEFSSHVSNSNL